jgi:hypothetical protein
VQKDGTTMKKRYLLLLAAIAIISVSVFILAVVLPTWPAVTKANFDRIKTGMTYAEVVEILGEKPPSGHGWDVWQAADGSAAYVSFNDGRVLNSL